MVVTVDTLNFENTFFPPQLWRSMVLIKYLLVSVRYTEYGWLENCNESVSDFVTFNDMSSEAAQTETNINFKTVIEKFTNKERCEKAVDSDLADMVNNLFRDAIPDDKYNDLVKKYNRPENCQGLSTVRVNQLVWDIIRPESRSLDVKFQAIQASLVKRSTAITQLVSELAKHTKADNAAMNAPKLLDLSTDALALFGNAKPPS